MRTIEAVYREYVELYAGRPLTPCDLFDHDPGDCPHCSTGTQPPLRTPLELQTAIEALGLHYEGVGPASFWALLAGDWLDGTQAGHPFGDDALNARYCDLAVARGLLELA